jgi:hypothetical protein
MYQAVMVFLEDLVAAGGDLGNLAVVLAHLAQPQIVLARMEQLAPAATRAVTAWDQPVAAVAAEPVVVAVSF